MSEYLHNLIKEIERLKQENKRIFFRMNEKISKNVAEEIEKHFSQPQYDTEIRKCKSCGGYDIIIRWSL